MVLGVILASITGTRAVRDHIHDADITEKIHLDSLGSDTLYINVMDDVYFNDDLDRNHIEFFELMKIEDGKVILGEPVRLRFYERDSTKNFMVEVEKQANGPYHSKAIEYSENIDYDWNIEGNVLNFSPNLSFPYNDRYHAQEVQITVYVPEGKYVQLSDNAGRIYWRPKYEGKLLKMESDDWKVIND
jgi:hypothetical protein